MTGAPPLESSAGPVEPGADSVELTSEQLLVAVAALGGDDIDRSLASPALAARQLARSSINKMRGVPLALVDAIEPGHAAHRLRAWEPRPSASLPPSPSDCVRT